jgi:hypothetical protein
VAYPGILFGGGGSTSSVADRGQREGGSRGDSPPPRVRVPLNLQVSETRILIRLIRMYFPRSWEFDSALSKLRNFGEGGGGLKSLSVRHWFM